MLRLIEGSNVHLSALSVVGERSTPVGVVHGVDGVCIGSGAWGALASVATFVSGGAHDSAAAPEESVNGSVHGLRETATEREV